MTVGAEIATLLIDGAHLISHAIAVGVTITLARQLAYADATARRPHTTTAGRVTVPVGLALDVTVLEHANQGIRTVRRDGAAFCKLSRADLLRGVLTTSLGAAQERAESPNHT